MSFLKSCFQHTKCSFLIIRCLFFNIKNGLCKRHKKNWKNLFFVLSFYCWYIQWRNWEEVVRLVKKVSVEVRADRFVYKVVGRARNLLINMKCQVDTNILRIAGKCMRKSVDWWNGLTPLVHNVKLWLVKSDTVLLHH